MGVGAQRKKGGVTEANQAGIADEQHQSDPGNGKDKDLRQFTQEIAVQPKRATEHGNEQ